MFSIFTLECGRWRFCHRTDSRETAAVFSRDPLYLVLVAL